MAIAAAAVTWTGGIIGLAGLPGSGANDALAQDDSRVNSGIRANGGGRVGLPEIRRRLQGDGFSQITFTDRRLPVYVAEACRNGNRVRLEINRRGQVRDRRRIGRCGAADPAPTQQAALPEIRRTLQRDGFSQITFTDRRLPVYVA
ncbi:MAG: hypothetical protein AAFQ35_13700, partial [Pseudomonadota bacterium]